MIQMLVRHKVADFAQWNRVFGSHRAAQEAAGLRIQQVLSNLEDPSEIFLLFEVDDVAAARRFVNEPQQPEVKQEAGVLDEPDLWYLGPAPQET
jgi:hypothetical protein